MTTSMTALKNIGYCSKILRGSCYSKHCHPIFFIKPFYASSWRYNTDDASMKDERNNDDFFGIDDYCQHLKTDKQSTYESALTTKTDNISSHRQNKRRTRAFYGEFKKSITPTHFSSSDEYSDRLGLSDITSNHTDSEKASSVHGRQQVEHDYIDGQYFKYNQNSQESMSRVKEESLDNIKGNQNGQKQFSEKELYTDNLIDDQYFIYEKEQKDEVNRKSLSDGSKSMSDYDINNMEFIDDQYFGASSHNSETFADPVNTPFNNPQKEFIGSTNKNTSKPMSESAYDIAMKIRQEVKQEKQKNSPAGVSDSEEKYSGPVDSKGFRVLKYQVQDIMKTPSGMVVDLLKKTILYNRGDIVAIDKPYGLPSHGGPGVHMSVGQLLPALAERLDPTGQLSSLHLINRLDKETTGVMLLAKTAQMAVILKGYFIRREIIKKYWVITKGVPRPVEGIVKIPISESDMGKGIHRMTLKPEYHKEYDKVMKKRNLDGASEAITKYKVLQEHGSAALVECQPITGVKHQIRVHFGFGLNTPILGDHKYSHFSKLAPQRLHSDMLVNLGIRQSKARHVPMHLHAKSLVIPEFENGRNLIISAKLPRHFLINMRRLKLNKNN